MPFWFNCALKNSRQLRMALVAKQKAPAMRNAFGCKQPNSSYIPFGVSPDRKYFNINDFIRQARRRLMNKPKGNKQQ